ncbi:MAG: dockerin type I repeat-containing protein [Ruminococcus sp.]|nr:dockerin type I repeat-containing protein [Ruminococcus sp.]
MKNKLLSFLTAGMMLATTATLPPAHAAERPELETIISTLPDWTPMNFIDAMEFYNTYGKTHVEDNFICLVKPMRSDEIDKYRTSYSGSMAMINTPACTGEAVFELEIPEQPDPNDEEALAEYVKLCKKLGVSTDDYSFFENYAKSEIQYAFKVQFFRVLEGHDLTVEWIEDLGEGYKKKIIDTFTFENPSGFIEQTDIYNWLPDCPAEYTWLESYSHHSNLASCGACVYSNPYTHTPYIAYCANVNGSTGASLEMEQNGDGEIEYIMESDCNGFDLRSEVELVGGQSSRSVMVYEPIADGLVDVKWSVGRHWSDESPFDITIGRYNIKNNCSEIVDCSNRSTIITFIDKATGELIDVPENSSFMKSTIQDSPDEPCLSELYLIDSNPCVIDSNRAYDPNCGYSFNIGTEDGYYEFEGFEVTSEDEKHINVNCYLSYRANPEPVLPDGATRVIIYDEDTGELIPDEVLKLHEFTFGTSIGIKNPDVPGGWMYTGPFYTVNSNNYIIKNDQLAHYHKYADSFSFTTKDKPEVIYYSNESMDLIFRIKIKVSGDINGNDNFDIADAVTLQKWLLGVTEVEIWNGADGDFCLDGKLDVFDLCIMKRILTENS